MRGTAYLNLGAALMKMGRFAEAETALNAALAQPQPDTRADCLLADVYRNTRRMEPASSAETRCHSRVPNEQIAINSYQEASYQAALNEFRPLADKGNATAQLFLGLMYNGGQSVSQDLPQAAEWYRKAAEQGNANAQFNLGMMYRSGQGVPQNWSQAYKWFSLAALSGNVTAMNAKQEAEANMTPEQIKEANALIGKQ